ncbi:MAG: PaaI family thioesterase [Microthrixaceae bacterium]
MAAQHPGDEPDEAVADARSVRVDGLSSLRSTPQRVQQRRLAAAAREVITRMVSSSAGEEELRSAAERLEEVAELLGELPSGQLYEGFSEAANAGPALRAMALAFLDDESGEEGSERLRADDPERFAFFDQSPLIGLANPLSPPLVLDHDPGGDSRLRGRVVFGPAYEGPPGCVHGGYVAAVFDELLGATQSLSGSQGMTAHLGVDYRSPTPLGEELTMHGWLERTEGRKI